MRNKLIVYNILLGLHFLPVYSMDERIERATHYTIIRGGVTIVYDCDGQREVHNKPQAWFLGNNSEAVLKEVQFDQWDKKQEEKFDAMLDPEVAQLRPSPTEATIFWHIKTGRSIRCNNGYGYHRYNDGPLDIKGAENCISLKKPHSIFNSLKEVTEKGYIISPLLGLEYDKKKIMYGEGYSKIESITWRHRFIQACYTAIGVGGLYGTYKVLISYLNFCQKC